MQISVAFLSRMVKVVTAAMLALFIAQSARAEVYDFNRFLSGGGGGTLPERQRIVTTAGARVCVDISENRGTTNRVTFTVWNQIPQLKSRIGEIAFDTGRHKDLFTGMSVIYRSPGMSPRVQRKFSHAFLPELAGDFAVLMPWPDGVTPGKSLIIAATLGPGKSFADVMNALREGQDPSTAKMGFRVGAIVTHILGGPPPGVATINDDGGFLLTSVSTRCRAPT